MSDAPSATAKKTLLNLPDEIYFDRKKTVTELIANLKRDFIVAVIGENGSGKSTLVNTGLKNALLNEEVQGRAGAKWRIVRTMPFADPIGNLAADLTQPGNLFPKESKGSNFRKEVKDLLRESRSAIVQLYNQAVSESGAAFNFLLIVDQKQELFRYQRFYNPDDAGDDARYVNLLLNVARSSAPIYVVFITDNRYLEHFSKYRGLPEAMNNFRFTVPAITADEIAASIQPYVSEENKEEQTFFKALDSGFRKMLDQADPHAMQKSNLALSLVLQKWRKAKKDGLNPSGPMAFFKEIGRVDSVISHFVTREVLGNFDEKQRELCRLIFQALTELGGDNQYIRRPERMDVLIPLIRRHGMDVSPDDIKTLLERFNSTNETFIQITGSRELLSKAIVDINSDSLHHNWPLLRFWADTESTHANVYRNLVRDALSFYTWPGQAATAQTEGSTAADSAANNLIYDGSTLFSAVKWRDDCKPNDSWAERYLRPANPELSPEQQVLLQRYFPGKEIDKLSNLSIARNFLKFSESKFQDELEQKQRDVDKAMRQRRLALIGLGVAAVAVVFAAIFWYWAWSARRDIELIDFVEILDTNGALDIPQEDRFNQKNGMIYTIVKNTKINSKEKVLDFLTGDRSKVDPNIKVPNPNFPSPNHKALNIAPADKEISYSALLNLDLLFNELKKGEDQDESRSDILSIYNTKFSEQPNQAYKQFPYLYYALLAHLKAAGGGKVVNSPSARAEIEESALISNPKKKYEYAYGDKNGAIFVNSEDRSNRLDTANVVIQGMGYSRDGENLFIGTDEGKIIRYSQLELPSTADKKRHIYTDPREKTIYFVEEYDSLNYLLVSTTDEVYWAKPQNVGDNNQFIQIDPVIKMNMPRVGFTDWSPDHKWFLATGKGKTIIYQLDPFHADPKERIKETGCILHPDTTIMSLAIKSDAQGRTWLALGSKAGLIWITATNEDILHRKDTRLNSSLFTCYKNVHSSTVIGLAFNPGLPQMASASFDGTIQLWNLDSINSPHDHIRLPNFGQSVSSITYINQDELVAHIAIDTWVIKTNIHALKEELECYILKEKNCRHGNK